MRKCFMQSKPKQVETIPFYTFHLVRKMYNYNMIKLSTYLLFDDTCEEALLFYKSCLGGDLSLTKLADTPMKANFPENLHTRIINSRLKSESIDISASDWMAQHETPVRGNQMCLYIDGGDYDQTKAVFDKLSEGANVTDPLTKLSFGYYGALNDKFGVRWMFHCQE